MYVKADLADATAEFLKLTRTAEKSRRGLPVHWFQHYD